MARVLSLGFERNRNSRLRPRDAERVEDSADLLARLRASPGEVSWVVVAPDFELPSELTAQIRDADPSVSVVVLGRQAEFEAEALEIPGARDPEPTAALRREAERRALRTERLASTNALIASIAHDVGTPMTAILGYAELIAKSVGDAKNRKRAATIVEQVNRVGELIETLTKLAQTEARPPRPVSIVDLVDQALDLYREKLERCGIEIQRDYRRAPRVLGDPIRLHQVFLSVFLDAIDAMPDGGTLRVRVGEADPTAAEVRVQLTGTDGDAELCARFFDPRAAKPVPRAGGLGLLVAKTIVEEHDGKIALSADAGGAIELRLVLPRFSDDAR